MFIVYLTKLKTSFYMKLELKHLAPYLPYDLQIKTPYFVKTMVSLTPISVNSDCADLGMEADFDFIKNIKPILRPLSDLPKFGEVLKDIILEKDLYISKWSKGFDNYEYRIINKPFGRIFKISNNDEWVLMISLTEPERTKYVIFEKLLELHFDVFGLIDAGLAIDINTLEK